MSFIHAALLLLSDIHSVSFLDYSAINNLHTIYNCFHQKSNAQTAGSRHQLSARKTHCLVRMVRFVATILFVSVACGIWKE